MMRDLSEIEGAESKNILAKRWGFGSEVDYQGWRWLVLASKPHPTTCQTSPVSSKASLPGAESAEEASFGEEDGGSDAPEADEHFDHADGVAPTAEATIEAVADEPGDSDAAEDQVDEEAVEEEGEVPDGQAGAKDLTPERLTRGAKFKHSEKVEQDPDLERDENEGRPSKKFCSGLPGLPGDWLDDVEAGDTDGDTAPTVAHADTTPNTTIPSTFLLLLGIATILDSLVRFS